MRKYARWRLSASLAGLVLASGLVLGGGAQADHLADNGLQMTEVAQISAGWNYTCAVTTGGDLYCWGTNHLGGLGDGTFGTARPVPKRVEGFDGAKVSQVSAGVDHACALSTTGEVWCWGSNLDNQLGYAPAYGMFNATPRQVSGLSGTYVAVTAGANHTCALRSDGTPYCWGSNSRGQLGNGNWTSRARPGIVDHIGTGKMGKVRQIVAGQWFSCAVSTSDTAWCWGDNREWQLGVGTAGATGLPASGELEFNRPQRVTTVAGFSSDNIADIDVGNLHACAVTKGDNVYCWGSNVYGQVGAGVQGGRYQAPNRVAFATSPFSATDVTVGAEHSCARLGGTAWCWGHSVFGALGDGTVPYPTERRQPQYPVEDETLTGLDPGPILQIEAGANHTCSVNQGARPFCWGSNSLGQIGDGTFVQHRWPSAVFAPPS